MRTNLIVGGTGFIGGHLAEYFFTEGEISKGIFRKGSHLRILDQCGIQCLEADIMDRHSLHEPLDTVDTVYFLASPRPGRPHEEYEELNRKGLGNLLEEASEHGAKTFVYLSTLDVYGFRSGRKVGPESKPNPTDEYQRSKLQGEEIVREFGKAHPELQVRVVRAAKGVGPRDPALVTPILKMIEGGKVVLPSGSKERFSLAHPKDIAQALLKSATSAGDSAPHQIKSFDATMEELAWALVKAGGKTAEVKQQGVLTGRGAIGQYASEEIRAGLTLEEQNSGKNIGYSPAYDLERTATEVAAWYGKEPWVTKEQE